MLISDTELERFNRSRDDIKRIANGYAKRAECEADVDKRNHYKELSESLEFFYNESAVLIPNKIIFKDGSYYCPSCKARIGAVYTAASDADIPVSFCICCGQAFNSLIGFGGEEKNDS